MEKRREVELKKVLITGANKGIGLAIARALLDKGVAVVLGSRDLDRGQRALESLGTAARATLVQLDVQSQPSIDAALKTLQAQNVRLDALVNNAGVATGFAYKGADAMRDTLSCNFFGAEAVTRTLLPLIVEGGRIVMIGSGAGPTFVEKCSAERQALLTDPQVDFGSLKALCDEAQAVADQVDRGNEDADAAFAKIGLNSGAYGLSKACLAAYAMHVARNNPGLTVSTCSPGFIATDMVQKIIGDKSPEEVGALPVDKGAYCPTFLVLGDVPSPRGEAWFFGSDARRSPLHKYRSPNDPPYEP